MPTAESPEKQFAAFLARYAPEVAALATASIAKLRSLLPEAIEMVYDNYYALVVGFSPTERPSDAVLSIAIYPDHVTLCFLQGAKLPKRHAFLKGSGNLVRHTRLEDAAVLDKPTVRDAIADALAYAKTPFDGTTERKMIIKSVSARQRPRRPKAARKKSPR